MGFRATIPGKAKYKVAVECMLPNPSHLAELNYEKERQRERQGRVGVGERGENAYGLQSARARRKSTTSRNKSKAKTNCLGSGSLLPTYTPTSTLASVYQGGSRRA